MIMPEEEVYHNYTEEPKLVLAEAVERLKEEFVKREKIWEIERAERKRERENERAERKRERIELSQIKDILCKIFRRVYDDDGDSLPSPPPKKKKCDVNEDVFENKDNQTPPKKKKCDVK